jgi:hypothetical protein
MDSLTSVPRKPKKQRLRDIVDIIKQQMSDLIVQCPHELHVGLLMNMNSLIEASFMLGKEHGKSDMARDIAQQMAALSEDSADDTETVT